MLRWQEARLCDLDKGLLADILNTYADGLITDKGSITSILAELRSAAEDINKGTIRVANLSMGADWQITTANEMLYQNQTADTPVYRHAVTVAGHMQEAFKPLMAV